MARFCPDCGSKRAGEAAFCEECGHPFVARNETISAMSASPGGAIGADEPALATAVFDRDEVPVPQVTGAQGEEAGQPSFSNEFGEVYRDRICFNVRKDWFSGSIREDIPIRHVTSVRHEISRNVGGGVVLVLIGLVLLSMGGVGVLLGLVAMAIGAVLLLGSPSVTINTAGGDLRTSSGGPTAGAAAEEFATAARNALFYK